MYLLVKLHWGGDDKAIMGELLSNSYSHILLKYPMQNSSEQSGVKSLLSWKLDTAVMPVCLLLHMFKCVEWSREKTSDPTLGFDYFMLAKVLGYMPKKTKEDSSMDI